MIIETCSGCGAVYEIDSRHVPMRDKDSLECDICHTEIYSWNEAKIFFKKLIKKGKEPKKD